MNDLIENIKQNSPNLYFILQEQKNIKWEILHNSWQSFQTVDNTSVKNIEFNTSNNSSYANME